MKNVNPSFWQVIWNQFSKHLLGYGALIVVGVFCLIAIYAPFLASSKPLIVKYNGEWYFPLFRYLFFKGFFTKSLDLFYNLMIFTFPLFLIAMFGLKNRQKERKYVLWGIFILQIVTFSYYACRTQQDPASSVTLNRAKQQSIQEIAKNSSVADAILYSAPLPSWENDLKYMNAYAQLNLILRYQQRKAQQDRLKVYEKAYQTDVRHRGKENVKIPTLWELDKDHEDNAIARQKEVVEELQTAFPAAEGRIQKVQKLCESPDLLHVISCEFLEKLPKNDKEALLKDKQIVDRYNKAMAQIRYFQDRRSWLDNQTKLLSYEVMPLLRPFHWEDDAGGDQALNRYVSWWDLTRINRKDMVASLIFGVRISLSVGLLAIGLALLIGIPIGAAAGYYGGRVDMLTYRLIEIWESMPTFFMLLLVVAFLQSKSIFLVIAVIGLFGWTGFSRFVRGEFFRQKQLPYVEACHAMGYNDSRIMFSHLLPNAIPPLLTLIPFAIMGAITSEAGLSFLGLGEEGSSSWGVLMDEGRTAFPSESYLLWPPAILLTILLVAVALVGDALRDALDPKLHH